jgi:hypothetical protein
MQKDVVIDSDSVPVSFYAQEATPYWTNRIDAATLELESEEMVNVTFQINMRLVLGIVTENYENIAETQIAIQAPVVLYYFGVRRSLKRTSADAPVQWLRPELAVITDFRADYNMQNSGIGVTQFGIDFSLEVPMNFITSQAVF